MQIPFGVARVRMVRRSRPGRNDFANKADAHGDAQVSGGNIPPNESNGRRKIMVGPSFQTK
jgi:hypothetical protein